MTPQKAIVNIIYAPQNAQPHKVYENEKGEIWRSGKYDRNKINVGMGWYSLKDPRPSDSILVVEPFCVLEKDYDVNFVKKFKYIFTWATKAFEPKNLGNKIVEINHPSFNNYPNIDNLMKKWLPWDKRKNEVVFIANNKSSRHHSELYSLRIQLADLFHSKSKLQVSWYGQIPVKKPYYKGAAPNKQDILRNVKFSVCTENSYDPVFTHNYFTEKLPEVWFGGAVPLYMGCHNIDSFGFHDHSYIDLRKYVKKKNGRWHVQEKALISRMENFQTRRYIEWSQRMSGNILKGPYLKKETSFQQAYETIIDRFYKDLNAKKA